MLHAVNDLASMFLCFKTLPGNDTAVLIVITRDGILGVNAETGEVTQVIASTPPVEHFAMDIATKTLFMADSQDRTGSVRIIGINMEDPINSRQVGT